MAFNNSPTDEWDNWGATENVVPQNSNTVDSEENWDNFDNNNQDGFNNLNTQSSDKNSNDGWDNFNNGFDNQNNGWDDFDKGQDNQNTQNNGWEDWDNQQPQDNSQSGSFINQQDGWDNFDSNQNQSGNFTNQQNNWGSQQPQNNNWNNQQPQNNNWNGMQNNNFDNMNNQNNQIPIKTPVIFNLSHKKIAFVIAGIFIVLAVLFMCIDKVHINKKPKTEQEQTTEVVEQSNESQNQTQSQNNQQVNTSPNSAVLVQIPEDTVLNYSGDVLEANGAVTSKTKFVQGHQVLYCVTINLTFGASSENINYYCNYASYNAVSVGDIVVVSYQQVDDSYISVNAISK